MACLTHTRGDGNSSYLDRNPSHSISGYHRAARTWRGWFTYRCLHIRRTCASAFLTSFWRDINSEVAGAETLSALPRSTMCFDKEHLHTTAQEKNSSSPVSIACHPFQAPLPLPLEPPLDLDHSANSRSVTSRCLRNKYYCPGQLDRAPLCHPWGQCCASEMVPGGRNVQWAIFKIDGAALRNCLFGNTGSTLSLSGLRSNNELFADVIDHWRSFVRLLRSWRAFVS